MQKQTVAEMIQIRYAEGKYDATIIDSINNILSKDEGRPIDLIKEMERFKALMQPTITVK